METTNKCVVSIQRGLLKRECIFGASKMRSRAFPLIIVKNAKKGIVNYSSSVTVAFSTNTNMNTSTNVNTDTNVIASTSSSVNSSTSTKMSEEIEKKKRRKYWHVRWENQERIYNLFYHSLNKNISIPRNFIEMPYGKYMKCNQLAKFYFSSQAEKMKTMTNEEGTEEEALRNETILKGTQEMEKRKEKEKMLNSNHVSNSKEYAKMEEEQKKQQQTKEKHKESDTGAALVNEQKEHILLKKGKVKNAKTVNKKIYEISIYAMKGTFGLLKRICLTTKKIILKPSLLIEYYHTGIKNVKHTLVWVKTGVLLFLTNMKISKNLIIKRLKGYRLSYSEYKLLIRTMNDMFKLIPFSFFIIIPFAEFLLPVFLKIYPNLLPSTFKNDDNFNNIKKNLYAKQQLAKFLQKLIEEKEKQLNENINADMDSDKKIMILNKFHQQLINKDEKDINPFLSANDTLKIAKLFKEDFVLDKMNLKTLQAICHLLGLKPYGMHYHVVLQLRHHFLRLQREDRELIYEGVENLKKHTLIEICKDRGMNCNTSEKEMILQIKQWLQLASIKEVPYILLLYIRCVIVTHSIMDIHDEQMKKSAASEQNEKQANTSAIDEKEKLIQEAQEKLDNLKMKEEEIKKSINKETKDEPIEDTTTDTDASHYVQTNMDGHPHGINQQIQEENDEKEKKKRKNRKVSNEKKLKIDVLKHNKYMQNELDLLKQICDLQHKELKLAFTSLTDLAENKQSCDLNELIKTMSERLSHIEKHLSELNAHQQIEMDAYFYPEEDDDEDEVEEEEEDKPADTMNLKSSNIS